MRFRADFRGGEIGKLDRRNGEKELMLPPCSKGARLDILVEAMGRINFGRAIKDFKGITGNVTPDSREGWPQVGGPPPELESLQHRG